MNRTSLVLIVSVILSPLIFAEQGFAKAKNSGVVRAEAFNNHRTDDRGLINSAYQGATGEDPVHLRDPGQYPRLNAELVQEIRTGRALLNAREWEHARIRTGLELNRFRTLLGLIRGDEFDAVYITWTKPEPGICHLENVISEPQWRTATAAEIQAKNGVGFLEVLDLQRKLETLHETATFLANVGGLSGRAKRRAQREFVAKFLNVNSLPVHLIRPEPSGQNLSVIFLADLVAEAGSPEFFQELLRIPQVNAAFQAQLGEVAGHSPSGGLTSVADFRVARSVYMTEYRKRQLGEDCKGTPGEFLLSMR